MLTAKTIHTIFLRTIEPYCNYKVAHFFRPILLIHLEVDSDLEDRKPKVCSQMRSKTNVAFSLSKSNNRTIETSPKSPIPFTIILS